MLNIECLLRQDVKNYMQQREGKPHCRAEFQGSERNTVGKNLNWQRAWRTIEGSSVCTQRWFYLSPNTLDICEICHIYWPYKGFTAILAILQRPPHFWSHGRKVKLGCELLWCVVSATGGDKVQSNCSYNIWHRNWPLFFRIGFYIKIKNYKI